MKASESILSLDPDSLLLILEISRAKGCLSKISATCRQLRGLSIPLLFEQIRLLPRNFTQETFIPESIRPHVRTVEFTHKYKFAYHEYDEDDCLVTVLPVLDIPDHQFLLNALCAMGRLRNLVVNTTLDQGLPFYILNAILSTPQLESVQFGPSMCYPVKLDPSFPKDLQFTSPVCSLTSFRRTLQSFERYSWVQAEADLLHCLFNQKHHTLQVAEMPSDTAPLRAFMENDWMCLRELILRGGSRQSSKPMVEILRRMPNLRVLKLELAQRSGEGPYRVCPPGWTGGLPWPKLEVLTISYPHPDDGLYAYLPSSIQELTLRCFPRHYVAAAAGKEGDFVRRHMYDSGWCSSLPSSSTEILSILRRCGSSLVRLRHLDVEFEESEEDVQLLRHIATAFSTLTFLQFLRYRKSPEHPRHTTSWADLGHALAPLTHLRLLRVHLDLEDTDDAGTVGEALSALARPLNSTVRFICSLTLPPQGPNDWNAYRIIRDHGTGEMIALENTDHYYAHIDGLSTSAEWTAYRLRRGLRIPARVVYPPY